MYLFYVDESGQREYNEKTTAHFVLAGVAIQDTDWRKWNERINEVKQDVFGTTEVEFKSTRLRQPDKCRRFYLEPFGLTEEALIAAIDRLYQVITEAPILLFAAVINKRHMMQLYPEPEPCTEMAYRMLIERLDGFLQGCNPSPCGLIIHDLIQESVSRQSRDHQEAIIDLHNKFLTRGEGGLAVVENVIEGVHFLPTSQSNFLQIADLVAYNVYRQFQDHWQEWEAGVPLDRCSKYPYFERILPKMHRSRAGRIPGFGIKKFPVEKRDGASSE